MEAVENVGPVAVTIYSRHQRKQLCANLDPCLIRKPRNKIQQKSVSVPTVASVKNRNYGLKMKEFLYISNK